MYVYIFGVFGGSDNLRSCNSCKGNILVYFLFLFFGVGGSCEFLALRGPRMRDLNKWPPKGMANDECGIPCKFSHPSV